MHLCNPVKQVRRACEIVPIVNLDTKATTLRSMVLASVVLTVALSQLVASAQDLEQLLRQATEAAQRGEHDRSIRLFTQVIESSPSDNIAWYLRGRENFRAGKISESVADFDKYVELEPNAESRQWERGISYYYAGKFAAGARQFETYQKFHDQDVENSTWRYLCVARESNVEKARTTLLPIQFDPRVPMMQIFGLYQGKLKPEDVLAAANENPPNADALNQRLFYAHLYIGLWHEAAGNAAEAKRHILEAERHKIAHYMWDVAHIHAQRLGKEPLGKEAK
jgi:lipoprotein NlpI